MACGEGAPTGLLAGVVVLEMASAISGPYAGMLLGDIGANVIKVEQPGTRDIFRSWSGDGAQVGPFFAAYNRGKCSVTIDVKKVEGQQAFLALARMADVVIENFRPGTLDRLDISYAACATQNARLIYCSITGMGNRGPRRDLPTYDATEQALSGLWSQFVDLANPESVGPPLCDQLTGLFAAYGIFAALYPRARSGLGQRVDTNLLSAALTFETNRIADLLMEGRIADRRSRARRSQSYAFMAGDGEPFTIHLSTPQKFWRGLTLAVSRPDLEDDPRFRTKAPRISNHDALSVILAEIFRSRSRSEWLLLLAQHDVPAARSTQSRKRWRNRRLLLWE